MKRYVVLVASEPPLQDAPETPDRELAVAHGAFEQFVDEHGRRISSAPLASGDTATTIRHTDGGVVVTDGPLDDSVGHVGCYYDLELPDLDSAIAAACLMPTSCTVEIRPVVTLPRD